MPLPSDPEVIFLGGLFALALLTAVYVAAEIVLPLVLAVVLKLLLQPAMRLLERWHIPRMVAALLLILAVFGTIVGLGAAIEGPASTWAAKLPEGIPRLQERLSFLQAPINTLQRFLQQVEGSGPPAGAPTAASMGSSRLMTKLFTGTRDFASGSLRQFCFSFSCSCLVTRSCAGLSRSCQASAISAKPSTSRNRSKAISPRIWSRLRS